VRDAGERPVVEVRSHAVGLVRPAMLLLALAWPVGWVVGAVQAPAVRWAVLGGAAALVTFAVVRPFLRWWTTTYALTTRRLSLRWGVLSRHGRDVPLRRVVDVRLERTLLQRAVGSGTVIVGTAGGEAEADETVVLRDVPQARRLHAALARLVAVEEEA
jgi:uncharacterized membrane protein YdbT with pleckstrin-like domain